jgi:hypothetical protein
MGRYLKTLYANTLVTLVLLSALSGVLLAIPSIQIAGAQVAPSITVSSDYFNPYKAIKVEVRGDFGPSITVRITNDITGEELYLGDVPRTATAYYVFYLGGPDAVVQYPGAAPEIYVDVAKGTPVRIDVLGTGLTYVVRYDIVPPTVTLDRKEYPYRRDAKIVITYVDPDVDYDPTARDTLAPANVGVDITLIKADGRVFTASTDLATLGASPSTEPAVISGRFTFSVWISAISTALGQPIGKDDRVLLSFYTKAAAQGWDDSKTTVDFKAVYRYPTVSVTFDYQRLVIDVTSPDDNVDSTVKDTLDPGAIVRLTVGAYSYDIPATAFLETGANTNVFRFTFKVVWGTAYGIDYGAKTVTLPVNTDGPFTATARYYKEAAEPGYSIDASGSGTYTPTLASLKVEKASVKTIIVTVTKPDLNNDAGSIEVLTPAAVLTSGKFDIQVNKDGVYVARIQIVDKDGNLVSFTGDLTAISFVETDFNSGVFTLRIKGDVLGIKAGETYTLKYCDRAGFAGKWVTATFTVAEVAVTLDRTEYPAALGGSIVVYVTYSNDLYNVDPTKRDTATVNYDLVAFDGTTVLGSDTITLTETDVDTGLFKGSATIAIPADDRVIGGKVVVYDPARPEAKVEATLKVYDGKLTVSPATIKVGGTITITVEDPDYNTDSGAKNSLTVTLVSGKCGKDYITLTETGANTGVFTASITWSRDKYKTCVDVPDTIEVRYVDTRAREIIGGYQSYTTTLTAKVTVASTTGVLKAVTAVEGKVSITETFKIVVEDWDENVNVGSADSLTVYAFVEGVHTVSPASLTLSETGASTGVFSRSLKLSDIRDVPKDISELAKLIGKRLLLIYRDDADETGAPTVKQLILTITAYDPELTLTPAAAINLDEVLTITVVDKNRVGAGSVDVLVKSTIYPIPITYTAREKVVDGTPTGVFELKIRIVDVGKWYPGYPEPSVPARFGDVVDVIYVAPVNSKGETNVVITKSIPVGVRPVMPAETRKVEFLSETGAPVTPKVGVTTFITVTVANVDIEKQTMTVMVVVRDPRGVAVAIYFAVVTLAPGATQPVGFGWVPAVVGKHTIEVYVVRSLADRTPMASPYTATVEVTS